MIPQVMKFLLILLTIFISSSVSAGDYSFKARLIQIITYDSDKYYIELQPVGSGDGCPVFRVFGHYNPRLFFDILPSKKEHDEAIQFLKNEVKDKEFLMYWLPGEYGIVFEEVPGKRKLHRVNCAVISNGLEKSDLFGGPTITSYREQYFIIGVIFWAFLGLIVLWLIIKVLRYVFTNYVIKKRIQNDG